MPDSPFCDFPDLHPNLHLITSPPTQEYNCIAWAAGDSETWWWPDEMGTSYWPSNTPRERTLLAFQLAYSTIGYVPCEDAGREDGFEKIALYADSEGPTHAARQLPDGRWTSKLGRMEDIEHATLECLCNSHYGNVIAYMKRQVLSL
jgi:hypothetical protein